MEGEIKSRFSHFQLKNYSAKDEQGETTDCPFVGFRLFRETKETRNSVSFRTKQWVLRIAKGK
jgi:hypothetical protein